MPVDKRFRKRKNGKPTRTPSTGMKHRGVCVYSRVLPSGNEVWRALYTDPDTGKKVHEAIPAGERESEPLRVTWAQRKLAELTKRTQELASGAPPKKGDKSTLRGAADEFLAANATLREKTLRGYRDAIDAMIAWADARGLVLGDDLRNEHLLELHGHLRTKPKRAPAKGEGKRFGWEATTKFRSAHTVNRELRALKTCLDYVRRLGRIPFVTKDAIEDNLKNLDKPGKEADPLKKTDTLKIMEAIARYDAEETELKSGERVRRFTSVAPYFAFLLLSGMREGEGRDLRWARVDLETNEIRLTPEDTKTKRGRTVDLAVSPVLRELLATMKLRAGDGTFVFGDANDEHGNVTGPALTRETVEFARRHLVGSFGAPKFTWQRLRVTCACYLVNAPGIFGGEIAHFRESRQLGHSIVVAEKHYTGVVKGIDPAAKTLEAAMGIEAKLREALGLAAAPEAKTAASS